VNCLAEGGNCAGVAEALPAGGRRLDLATQRGHACAQCLAADARAVSRRAETAATVEVTQIARRGPCRTVELSFPRVSHGRVRRNPAETGSKAQADEENRRCT